MGQRAVPLRPGEVDDFLATLDAFLAGALYPDGSGSGAELVDLAAPPQHCPHCGGSLPWGTGPHVLGAAPAPRSVLSATTP